MTKLNQMVPVDPDKAYRLLNIGATTVISAQFDGVSDAMAAAWACALDLTPCKATVVIDKSHYTRTLIEKSGYFALQLPTVAIAKAVLKLGSVSKNDDSEKLEHSGAQFFYQEGFDIPLLSDCAAWMIFKVIPNAFNEKTYDLFIGQCEAAWSDPRAFRDGHFYFETAPEVMRTLHYVAGGHFYAIGKPIDVEL
ncbi:MAG TPA: flavin reductase [Sutterella sp.]|nr:flavin reductase [Sutterella sp.]